MIRWIRSIQARRTTCFMTALVLAMIGCSSDDITDGDSSGASEIDLETETSGVSILREVDEVDDPAGQARIDLLTGDAMKSVVRAANFLAEQSGFRVVADISFDVRQSDGRLLEFGATSDITIRRPDRFRMSVKRRDGEARTLYFDGSTISIDLPTHKAFVREEREGTLYAALEHLSEELGAPVPLANLFSENFASAIENQADFGYYVGRADIGGRSCKHLAFRLPEVDVQFWVEDGERPLLARIVITHKHEDGNPQFRATLYDWDLTLETPETLFLFTPEEGSERLAVESTLTSETPGGEETE